jgi:hypothetical protein
MRFCACFGTPYRTCGWLTFLYESASPARRTNVQLHVQDALGSVDHRPSRQHGRIRHPGVNALNSERRYSSSGGVLRKLTLGGQSQVQVSRGNEQNVVLALHVDGDNGYLTFFNVSRTIS